MKRNFTINGSFGDSVLVKFPSHKTIDTYQRDNFAMFCRSCGLSLVLSANHCHNCGASVKEENDASASSTMTTNQQKVERKRTMTLSKLRASICSSALVLAQARCLK